MTSALMMPEKKMSSREIAELTEKQHQHVKRDCETMFAELNLDASNFGHIYLDTMNRKQTEYLLTYELVQTLITGYSIKLRHAVIQRLNELEAKQTQSPAISLPNFTDPAAAAIAWAAEYQAKQEAQVQVVQLESKVESMTPKVAAFDKLAVAEGSDNPTVVGKSLGLGQRQMFKLLSESGWIYKRAGSRHWTAYQDKIQSGYLEHKIHIQHMDDGTERVNEQVLITPKGRAKLALMVVKKKEAA